VIELLKKSPNAKIINSCSKIIDKNKFLFLCAEFPIEDIIKRAEHYLSRDMVLSLNKTLFITRIKKNMLIQSTTEITKAFNKNGIKFIILKGFAYPELIKTRRTSDIDFLIKPQTLNKCLQVLKSFGFVNNDKRSEYYFRTFSYHLNMHLKSNPEITIEPHWQIAPKFFPAHIDSNTLWRQSKKKNIYGQNVRVLSNEHNIIHLSLHALYQSALSTPFRDIYIISKIVSEKRIDWNALAEDALVWKINNFVYFSLFLAQKYFKARIPSSTLLKLKKKNFQYFMIQIMLPKKLAVIRTKKYTLDDFLCEMMFANLRNKLNIIKRIIYAIRNET